MAPTQIIPSQLPAEPKIRGPGSGESAENLLQAPPVNNERIQPGASDGPVERTRQEPNLAISRVHGDTLGDTQLRFPGKRILLPKPQKEDDTQEKPEVPAHRQSQTKRGVGRPRTSRLEGKREGFLRENRKAKSEQRDLEQKRFWYKLRKAMGLKDHKGCIGLYAVPDPVTGEIGPGQTRRWNVPKIREDAIRTGVKIPENFDELFPVKPPPGKKR
ncbi:hypothetical protein H0H93_014871 [Arthromyces matolae]|nr:hypothetical protein H0H93_014871 [Arthromyces matolae]